MTPSAPPPTMLTTAYPHDDAVGVTLLLAEAERRLTTGDVPGYARTFRRLGSFADPQRGHQAALGLLGLGITAAERPGAQSADGLLLTVVTAALDRLERTPAEPLLLAAAARACHGLAIEPAASALRDAAVALDPALAAPSAPPVNARSGISGRERLGERAIAITRRAIPSAALTISLCMIVRDEEAALGSCLAAAATGVDEIVLVDTGSQDRTMAIAREHGARVLEMPWPGSFAVARNAALDAASGDWLLVLDADEVVFAEHVAALRALRVQSWREAFSLEIVSYLDGGQAHEATVNQSVRLFRNRPGYRYAGEIHEQILPALPGWSPGRVAHAPVRVHHSGYLPEVRRTKEKANRNLTLLRAQATAGNDPFVHFNLGCEHVADDKLQAAEAEFARAWTMIVSARAQHSLSFAPALVATRVRVLARLGRDAEAMRRARDGAALYPRFTDLHYEQAALRLRQGDRAGAEALWRTCLELGDAPASFGARAGAGSFLPRLALALAHLDRGEPAPAADLLAVSVREHPSFIAAALPYATAYVRAGRPVPELVTELEPMLAELPAATAAALGCIYARAGAVEPAEPLLAAGHDAGVLEPDAAVAYAELVLARGAWAQAAALCAAVPDTAPQATLAARLELCARIAAGELDAARARLRRSGASGLPGAERDAFAGWIAAAAGHVIPGGLSPAGVPVLGALLDVLLGAGALDAVAQIIAVLEHSRLPRREQAELIASSYRRHGRLAEAARIWMAVCAEAPDARAMLGLARVARAHGLPEDAVNFARGALELDAGCAGAADLLAELDTAIAQA